MKDRAKYIMLVIAIIFIIMGIYRGEVAEILIKAINICLECIGIG